MTEIAKKYNNTLTLFGKILRNKIIFDITQDITYTDFFKTKFSKEFLFKRIIDKNLI